MTNANFKFFIVEDNVQYQKEVLGQLARVGFEPDNHLGLAANYQDAKERLDELAQQLDVVFLDLNIPRSELDPKPEDKHGTALLDLIHGTLNHQPSTHIRVIVVSGQDMAINEATQKLLMDHYDGTLVGVVDKTAMADMLKANLKRLRRDPIASALSRMGISLVNEWNTLTDSSQATIRRIDAGRKIAIGLAQQEIDFFEGLTNAHPEFNDNLGGLSGHLMGRFRPPEGKALVSMGTMATNSGWGGFLWRGVLMEHFRTINNYWNAFKHLDERPYDNPTSSPHAWQPPADQIEKRKRGDAVVQLVELMVRDLLEWYLPWHEQILLKNSN
jgi:CheY-like chemotaxis protein